MRVPRVPRSSWSVRAQLAHLRLPRAGARHPLLECGAPRLSLVAPRTHVGLRPKSMVGDESALACMTDQLQ